MATNLTRTFPTVDNEIRTPNAVSTSLHRAYPSAGAPAQAPRQGRWLGTLGPRGLSQQQIKGAGYTETRTPRPAAPAPQPPSQAAMNYLAGGEAPAVPAPYVPGSLGAPHAAPAPTAPKPAPQQTERANPLSGDNDRPMEGQTVPAPTPFSTRGAALPGGQDGIGASMQGTWDRLRGARQSFARPQQSGALTSVLRRAYPA